MPNGHHGVGEVSPYGTNSVEVRNAYMHQKENILDTENVDPVERPTSPVVGTIVVVADESPRAKVIGPNKLDLCLQ